MNEGWLIDANIDHKRNRLRLWIYIDHMFSLFYNYMPSLFLHSDYWQLSRLRSIVLEHPLVSDAVITSKRLNFYHKKKTPVLEVFMRPGDFKRVCKSMAEIPHVTIFNCDFNPISQFFFRTGFFPFGRVRYTTSDSMITALNNIDDRESIEYPVPNLTKLKLDVEVNLQGPVLQFSDPIRAIKLSFSNGNLDKHNDEQVVLDYFDESDLLLQLEKEIDYFDPDIVVTENGDSFLFPYLFNRAKVYGISLSLSRDGSKLWIPNTAGQSYWSYNRIYYRPPAVYLRGRLHFDKSTCYFYSDDGYEGVIEGSRISGLPPQKLARASIGTINAATQYIMAFKQDILIPERRLHFQDFRSADEIYVLDRGGLIFQPIPGIYEDVAELDFSSMYPMIMINNNISPETLCTTDRCPYNYKYCIDVPELPYRFCNRKTGLVPLALKPIVKKRLEYKRLMESSKDWKKYNRIQKTLKGVLVSCFGYLGFKNARFGRFEAHAAVTAFARETLLKTKEIAEDMGFEIIHGIVDSVWLKSKTGFDLPRVLEFAERVSKETNIPMHYNGRYRLFIIPSLQSIEALAPLNHYWGVFEDGRIKVRGLATRRHDQCNYVAEFQNEVIHFLARSRNIVEFMANVQDAIEILESYIRKLRRYEVPIKDLIITHRISHKLDDYRVQSRGLIAAKKLLIYGRKVQPGQNIQYIITDGDARSPMDRVSPVELISDFSRYDPEPYVVMLQRAFESLFPNFVRARLKKDRAQTSLLAYMD